jgi:tetratricopeptide (TPR) repeat protein
VVFAVTSQMSWDDELRLAYAHQQQGDFPAAISILERLVRQAETFGPEDPRLPIALNNLGRAHHDRGAWFEGEKSYRRAIAVLERTRAAARLVSVLNNLALMYIDAGQFHRAERIAARVAAALPHAPGLDPVEFTIHDHNRAYLHIAAGRRDEAAALLAQALRDAERRLGPGVPHIAGLLNTLGLNAMSQGCAAEAIPHFERALPGARLPRNGAHSGSRVPRPPGMRDHGSPPRAGPSGPRPNASGARRTAPEAEARQRGEATREAGGRYFGEAE